MDILQRLDDLQPSIWIYNGGPAADGAQLISVCFDRYLGAVQCALAICFTLGDGQAAYLRFTSITLGQAEVEKYHSFLHNLEIYLFFHFEFHNSPPCIDWNLFQTESWDLQQCEHKQ